MCGKTLDLKWLYSEKKCDVVGCELAKLPLQSFMKEHPELAVQESTVSFKDGTKVTVYHVSLQTMCCMYCLNIEHLVIENRNTGFTVCFRLRIMA